MPKIKILLKSILTQITILLIFGTFIYYRFIKNRALGPLDTQFYISKTVFLLIIIFIYIYIIYRIIKPPHENSKILKYIIKIYEWYKNTLKEMYQILQILLGPPYIRTIDKFTKQWILIPTNMHKISIYLVKFLFPLIIASYFFYEILYLKGIYNFPKLIWLLLFYFALDIIWYFLISYTKGYIEACETYLLTITLDSNNKIISIEMPKEENVDVETYHRIKEQFAHFAYEYVHFKEDILPFLLQYENYFNIKGQKSLKILRLSLWLISWVLILLYTIS